jgi:hypothetical protein
MPNPIFQTMLSRYSMRTKDERNNAMHEVMQQTALAGLYRGGFSTMQHFTEARVCGFFTACNVFRKIWIFRSCRRTTISGWKIILMP